MAYDRKKYIPLLLTAALTFFFFNAKTFPDTITMKDGRKFEGIVISEGPDYYEVKIKIGTMKLRKENVAEIKALSAEENFVRLGKQCLALKDFNAALEQFNKALKINPSSKPAMEGIEETNKLREEAQARIKAEKEKKEKEILEKQGIIEKSFGIALAEENGKVMVYRVNPVTSAEAIGIKPGDEILRIGELNVKDKSVESIADWLAKSGNTTFTFLIQRRADLTKKKIDYQKYSFTGVGIFLDNSGSDLVVNSVIVGEPADLAGLKSRDKVVSLNGKPAEGVSVDDATAIISADTSPRIEITIQRSIEMEKR
jgi:predicted metalloprotease with PDZ domain